MTAMIDNFGQNLETLSVPFVIHDSNIDFKQVHNHEKHQIFKMEQMKHTYTDLKAYHENFIFREKLIDVSKAIKIMIFPEFLIANKTQQDIYIHDQLIHSKTNAYLQNPGEEKVRFKVVDKGVTFESDLFCISTIGLSGSILLVASQISILEQFQFGISISQATYPFNKTTVVTIVPRYLLVNKLVHPVAIRQVIEPVKSKSKTQMPQFGQEIFLDYEEGRCQKELHFVRSNNKKKKNLKQLWQQNDLGQEQKIQFTATEEPSIFESHPDTNLARSKKIQSHINSSSYIKKDPSWCHPFAVDIMDEFQTEYSLENEREYLQLFAQQKMQPSRRSAENTFRSSLEPTKDWFYPQPYNNDQMITRVIITGNPDDNNATLLIIFDEPNIEEYVIRNKTSLTLEYQKYDHDSSRPISEWKELRPGQKQVFVWDYREVNTRNIILKMEGHTQEVNIDETEKVKQS